MDFRCCAVNGVTSTTNNFDLTPWCTVSGSCQQGNSEIPKSCCKDVDKSTYTSAPTECHGFVYSGYYNEKGCAAVWLDAVKDYTDEKKMVFLCGLVAAVSHAASLIFSLCLVLSLLVMNNIQVKENRVQNEEEKRKGMEMTEEGGGWK
ncbi:uncharacterized protein LOC134277624 [Saccostrea cucullata]|uniref:uncharacterized protein LOC134277624 n=1 Tax=Saccostrea cuccullata TaxID=36930 RepID=UPI002ECFE9EF